MLDNSEYNLKGQTKEGLQPTVTHKFEFVSQM